MNKFRFSLLIALLVIGLGLLAAPTLATAGMIDLGTLGGTVSEAYGINNKGEIVGWSTTAAPSRHHAFLYSGGVMHDLGTLPGGTASDAYAINDYGQIVGSSGAYGGTFAFLYSGGEMINLGAMGGTWSAAYGINNSGQIVGKFLHSSGQYHAFLYEGVPGAGGHMTDLGVMPGLAWSAANGINNSGVIVGICANPGSYAGIFSGGGFTDLGSLGGGEAGATGINDRGQIVGSSRNNHAQVNPFLYTGAVMYDLGSLGGSGWATGINKNGQIVGVSTATSGKYHAFLYTGVPGAGGHMTDLGTGWGDSSLGLGINDHGDIVGSFGTSSHYHAFVYRTGGQAGALMLLLQ
jgi:probable HAF family extracellular repeat protein